jgi:hypothetical protein
MNLTIDLPPELGASLASEAAKLQMPVDHYVVQVLAGRAIRPSSAPSGAEVVAYWQRLGLIGTRPDIDDPVAHSRRIREEAQSRNRPT